jgi:hypothetical protein
MKSMMMRPVAHRLVLGRSGLGRGSWCAPVRWLLARVLGTGSRSLASGSSWLPTRERRPPVGGVVLIGRPELPQLVGTPTKLIGPSLSLPTHARNVSANRKKPTRERGPPTQASRIGRRFAGRARGVWLRHLGSLRRVVLRRWIIPLGGCAARGRSLGSGIRAQSTVRRIRACV